MNEVEKMYENAGIEGEILRGCYDYYSFKGIDIWTVANCKDTDCKNCKYNKFIKHTPPFTAEKQLELIKWLIRYDELHADFNDNMYSFSTLNYSGKYKKDFSNALANVITNELWQDLTEEERKQIKEILE